VYRLIGTTTTMAAAAAGAFAPTRTTSRPRSDAAFAVAPSEFRRSSDRWSSKSSAPLRMSATSSPSSSSAANKKGNNSSSNHRKKKLYYRGFSGSIQDELSLGSAKRDRHAHPLSAAMVSSSSSSSGNGNDASIPAMQLDLSSLPSIRTLRRRRRTPPLTTVDEDGNELEIPSPPSSASSWFDASLVPVVSAAMLITGNTIGASCLVLPEVASGPGLASSIGLFGAAYLFNWVSGITLAEVAIRQREDAAAAAAAVGGEGEGEDDSDVPSSFKEFAQVNLNSDLASTAISVLSFFVNSCVLSFDLTRAGAIGQSLTGMSTSAVTCGWAACLLALVTTQSGSNLSKVASGLVAALFLTFGSILLPGLAGVHDPVATLFQPGTADTWLGGMSHAAPVILMTLVYQNIVPSITKILNYDRTKTVTAITLGSFVPFLLYVFFCYAALGGGIDASSLINGGGGALLTAFSCTTLAGSSLGSVMSMSEELDTYIKPDKGMDEGFQLPSVLASVAVPVAAAIALSGGDDITQALQYAGSFGTPLLYGVLPAMMAWNQRKPKEQQKQQQKQPVQQPPMVPTATLGMLGVLSTSFVGQEVLSRVGEVLPAFAQS